jgi:hemerythrin
MALIEKTDVIVTGYDLIDNDHEEFINLLNQLDSASNAEFPACSSNCMNIPNNTSIERTS